MAFDMAKFMARFIEEAREHIEKLNEGLVSLEKNPEDAETINSIFRSAHTIKGSSRMMKLSPITEVAHKMEDALGALREKRLIHSKELADLLFRGIDMISEMLDRTSEGQPIETDSSALCEQLSKAAEAEASPQEGKPELSVPDTTAEKTVQEPKQPENPVVTPSPALPAERQAAPQPKARTSETVRINSEKLDDLIKLMGEMVSNQNRLKQRLSDAKDVEISAARHVKMLAGLEPSGFSDYRDEIIATTQSIFIKIKKLVSSIRDDASLHELLTGELQEKSLVMRMVPLSTLFDPLHRIVRDIAKAQGKDVELVIEGGEIELDKKMSDKLGDPLVHMLRNAVDHGIECRVERKTAGKPEGGTIRLLASYEAGSVLIEVGDDGKGIALEKIKEKALRKKMYDEKELDAITEAALVDLIFQPGFSTSAIITDVSGRGVGMDVVKRNIVEDLRGTIGIRTREGGGTVFSIRLPLTLAVMRILLISAGGGTFGVAAHYINEIIRVPETELIQVLDKKAVRLREEFIPVVSLEKLLGLPGREERSPENALIVIVRMGSEKLGLIADTLIDEEDMVIKSLPGHMKNVQLVSGITISGRNEIINVLHVPALMQAAKEVRDPRHAAETRGDEAIHILVVDDSVNTREIEKSILESYGYKVTMAGDGMEALEKAGERSYDLVITDVEMPRLDGFSLTERLRKDEIYKDTPIIIVTSREKEEDKRRGIMVGADAYIVKGSFDQSNLLETVQNLVG
jgi:chemotaxis protein histidine kinase CheA